MKLIKKLVGFEFKTKGLFSIFVMGCIGIVVLIKIIDIKNIKPINSFWSILDNLIIIGSWFGITYWIDCRIHKKFHK